MAPNYLVVHLEGHSTSENYLLAEKPTFPVLASHHAETERTLEISFDSEAIPRLGATEHASAVLERRRETIWETRSRFHVNTDFRFNSQSLTFCITIKPKSGSWVIATMGRIGAFDGDEHNSCAALTSPGG